MSNSGLDTLASALDAAEEGLLTCVHCGFCLPACPTYLRLGDENDSPRGRLHLMRAVAEGRIEAESEAFQTHIDRCLGCRACEPVCPSGVPYGSLLELARREATEARGARPLLERLLLSVFGSRLASGVAGAIGVGLRSVRLTAIRFALPKGGRLGAARRALGMLAATAPVALRELAPGTTREGAAVIGFVADGSVGKVVDGSPEQVAILRGCVQRGLYRRVNVATERVLVANGFEVFAAPGQGCCGALHAHAGDLDGARDLARANIERFEATGVARVIVNAAGCGAAMKEYGHWLSNDSEWSARAHAFSSKCFDVSEVLVDVGPRPGAALEMDVAYDPPCHLVHAQRVADPPERVLRAIPGLSVASVRGGDGCCGGAGIYALTHEQMGGAIGSEKVAAVNETGATVVATGNPGCMMQIGAGLIEIGSSMRAVHPVELLDESYRRAGYYDR